MLWKQKKFDQPRETEAAHNADYLPYSGWGGLPDRDCLAYSKDLARYPGAGRNDAATVSNQVQAFRKGQLGPYLVSEKVLTCPKDASERGTGVKLRQYLKRDVKIISYLWNGAINNYESGDVNRVAMSRWTLSTFSPTGMLIWEAVEMQSEYTFNDASSTPHEGISRRHGSSRIAKDQTDKVKGIATFGNLSGSAFTVPLTSDGHDGQYTTGTSRRISGSRTLRRHFRLSPQEESRDRGQIGRLRYYESSDGIHLPAVAEPKSRIPLKSSAS